MVLAELKVDNIYIVCGYTDMRKSIAGLSAIIIQQFQMRPDEHSMFLFCGKRADRTDMPVKTIKIRLYGLCRVIQLKISVNGNLVVNDDNCDPHSEWRP